MLPTLSKKKQGTALFLHPTLPHPLPLELERSWNMFGLLFLP